jgi:hypothetical protein
MQPTAVPAFHAPAASVFRSLTDRPKREMPVLMRVFAKSSLKKF